jgi:CarD family transcriptional regulator
MAFSVGDKIVHPGIGAGQIVGTKRQEFVKGFERYYVIEIPARDSTVYIPIRKMDDLGVRPIISQAEAAHIFDILSDTAEPLPKDHRERQQRVEDKLGSGCPVEIAQAVRDLAWRKHVAHLTKKDQELLHRGRALLAGELALVTDDSLDDVNEVIADALTPEEAEESEPTEAAQKPTASGQSSEVTKQEQGLLEMIRRRLERASRRRSV